MSRRGGWGGLEVFIDVFHVLGIQNIPLVTSKPTQDYLFYLNRVCLLSSQLWSQDIHYYGQNFYFFDPGRPYLLYGSRCLTYSQSRP